MQLTRRRFFRTSAFAAAAATASLSCPPELLAIMEPRRANSAAGPISLNSNEFAYGAWPSVMEAMRDELASANRYPDDYTGELINAIAKLHNVKPSQVIVGCGSSQILQMVANVYCTKGTTLVQAAPSYEAMAHHAKVAGGAVEYVPLNANFEHDVAQFAARKSANIFYICNPNNPTASITPRKKMDDFIAKAPANSIIFIDEAYHHFATHLPDYVSYLDRPANDSRVIVTRTFSKIYGLAGIRSGYAVASEEIIAKLRNYNTFTSVNTVAVAASIAALADMQGLAKAKKQVDADREAFLTEAKRRNLDVIPSAANFAMVDSKRPIRQVIQHFASNGVSIGRPFPPYDTRARISFGTPEEMGKFWSVWDKMA